jgi:hypothetical protein
MNWIKKKVPIWAYLISLPFIMIGIMFFIPMVLVVTIEYIVTLKFSRLTKFYRFIFTDITKHSVKAIANKE